MHKPGVGKTLLAFVICIGATALAPLADAADSGPYAGVGVGIAESSFDKDSVQFDAPDTTADETAWRLFGGYRYNKYVALEAGYAYLGKATVQEKARGDYFETEVSGFDVTMAGSLPLGSDVSVFARGGLIFWHSDVTYHLTVPGTGSRTRSGTDLVLGLGANYDFTRTLAFRAEFSLYDIDKTKAGSGDFKVVSMSAVFLF